MENQDIKYLRYADDWIILAKTKHKLRKAVKVCKQILTKLKLKEHPDKTDYRNYNPQSNYHSSTTTLGSKIIDKRNSESRFKYEEQQTSTKSFDFLGVEFNHKVDNDIKKETKENFKIKISRLYEQILTIMNYNNKITKGSKLADNLKDYLQFVELLLIKKWIRGISGFNNFIRIIIMPYSTQVYHLF